MASVTSSRTPPLRRRTRGKALLAVAFLVVALSALAAPSPGAAYPCSAGEGRTLQNRIEDCRRPVKTHRRSSSHETGRKGVTPLILLVLALGGTLVVPIGFDRVKRPSEDRLLR